MKILFYIDGIGGGGAERVVANLANGFTDRGQDVVLVTSFPREEEYFLLEKIKRYNLEERPPSTRELVRKNIRRIRRLRRICRIENCDVAVSFMEGPNFRLIFSTLFLRVKTIISLRSDPNREYAGFFHRKLANLVYSLADACVFQTEEAMDFFSKPVKRKGTVIYNPVSEEFYGDKPGARDGGIISVGRLEPTKNFELIIDSFSKILTRFPDEKLTIYGEGSSRNDLKEMISALGLEEKIFLPGGTEDISDKIRDAKIFILSSDYEGMPNSLMEAMASGIPVISTDCPCGGPKLLLEEGKNGMLVPVRDSNKMASALEALLADKEKRQYFSRQGRIRAEAFKIGKICDNWLRLFHLLMPKKDKEGKI